MEAFFVGIKDPVEVRKELLTSSKNIIDSLKRYEAYKQLRENKLEYILELKRVFDELLVLNRKVRKSMPKMNIKSSGEQVEQITETVKEVKKKAPTNKLDLLEQELAKVEARLGSLR